MASEGDVSEAVQVEEAEVDDHHSVWICRSSASDLAVGSQVGENRMSKRGAREGR